ncbi:MAG: DHH family phosphoesterase, partial [Clostridia bacterium]|nr:DHH family phosphoesterase [Clostridia bacterium]
MEKNHKMPAEHMFRAAVAGGAALVVFALLCAAFGKYVMAAAELAAGAAVIIFASVERIKFRHKLTGYLSAVSDNISEVSEANLDSVPIAMAICSVDGMIRWYNDLFGMMFKGKELSGETIENYIHELKWANVLKFPKGKVIETHIGENVFALTWRMIKDSGSETERYSVYFYFRDITAEIQLKEAYNNERIDTAVINIDNYDEFLQRVDDDTAEEAASRMRGVIASWARESNAVLKKTDRDRYFAAFEHQYLDGYVKNGFDIIKKISDVAKEFKFPLSISIGIGTGGSMYENEVSARNALDLALGRGGGQVCIKDDMHFKFYGGKSGDYERSSRVKARAVAAALAELIAASDKVIFMGHASADFDCFGAAVGLQRAVRVLGKTPYIVHDDISPAIDNMYAMLINTEEYNGMFISESEALERVNDNTLVVVLDTHRPSLLPCPELLERTAKVVLIDHHRRSTEFIGSCSLIYHEPYASSTSEMVTELLEYMNAGDELTKLEAECIYSGIILDTKNFMLKTGVRTFEAASYLRRMGLDTVAVKRMFSTDKSEYAMKSDIVKSSTVVADEIAVGKTYTSDRNMRQIASQAADDMLNLENVAASVVVYPANGGTGFSARSIGSINVQLIMEKLGGGGHMTVAGAYIQGIDVDEGTERA